MSIAALKLTQFRNLNGEFKPIKAGLNIFQGQNGSGKTSILEAIYYLGHGRSFRTSNLQRLIQEQTSFCSVFAQIDYANHEYCVGLERKLPNESRLRINGESEANIAKVTRLLPLRVIDSQTHQILEAGPQWRRKYLDWGLFYAYDEFIKVWRAYERALKQRNSLLKMMRPKVEIRPWSHEVAKYGEIIHTLRYDYINQLLPHFQTFLNQLLPLGEFNLTYQAGWDETLPLSEVLNSNYAKEFAVGFTKFGPHRADIEVLLNGLPTRHFLSRGQQKLLICAMILAQGKLYLAQQGQGLIYMLDDLPAELDKNAQMQLISMLEQQKTQVFVTAIERADVNAWRKFDEHMPMQMFHVEHSQILTG